MDEDKSDSDIDAQSDDREGGMTIRARVLCLLGPLLVVRATLAQDQPPDLAPPALTPPTTAPPAAQESRPLLVIPGVTAPASRRPAAKPRPSSRATTPAGSTGLVGSPRDGRVPPQIPLSLEPIPDSEKETRTGQRASRSGPAERQIPPPGPASAMSRFRVPWSGLSTGEDPESVIVVEPRSDPAAEAATKRRIEKQIEQALGDRIRSAEVRVSGRSLVIRARAARFWQKRGVRRSLESLPLPSGYRARVELVD